ncbi:BrnA antitoxin family protein [Yoonia sp.]|uniref:BrnA antitoxin family protein n=1 Tax=Yoonia sp. TaxID=2212373 RepID=UPI002FD8F15E
MTKPRQMTQNQRIYWSLAVDAMRRIEWDQHATLIEAGDLPEGWDAIWNLRAQRDTTTRRVTIRLDADVVKFFKAMGEGYQPRINAVLRAFMYFRLAGVVEGPESGISAVRFVREAEMQRVAAQGRGGRGAAEEAPVDYEAIRASIGERLDRIRKALGEG